MIPFSSLSGASSLGPGSAKDLGDALGHQQMFVAISGLTGMSPVVSVVMELSHDNVNWYSMNAGTTIGITANGVYQQQYSGYLARYVRANVTQLDNVSAVSIDATIACAAAVLNQL